MKRIYLSGLFLALAIFGISVSCTKQNEPVALKLPSQVPIVGSDEYYASLRSYKQSDHQIMFLWWGDFGIQDGSNPIAGLSAISIPDSVDYVSLTKGFPAKGTPNEIAIRDAQKRKGTKFLLFSGLPDYELTAYNGNLRFDSMYVGKGDSILRVGYNRVAKSILDTINKYGYDGLDIDHEPNYCGCSNWTVNKDYGRFQTMIDVFSKYFGPKSSSGLFIDVDGEYQYVGANNVDKVNYLVAQAYAANSNSALQSRFDKFQNVLVSTWAPSKKFVVTENFQTDGLTGGVTFTSYNGVIMPSLLGFATWNPVQGRKGGAGCFIAQVDYANGNGYKYVRNAIQIMNPSVK